MEISDDELSFDVAHNYGISNDFAAEMSKLAFNGLHSDIILVCEGERYHCHKVRKCSIKQSNYLNFTGSSLCPE